MPAIKPVRTSSGATFVETSQTASEQPVRPWGIRTRPKFPCAGRCRGGKLEPAPEAKRSSGTWAPAL